MTHPVYVKLVFNTWRDQGDQMDTSQQNQILAILVEIEAKMIRVTGLVEDIKSSTTSIIDRVEQSRFVLASHHASMCARFDSLDASLARFDKTSNNQQ